MKGRKPTPAEAMQARGTRKKHRDAGKAAAKAAARSKALAADAPDYVDNADARAFWTRISDMLSPLGFIRSTDELVLALLCDTLAEYRQCTAEIAAAGGLTYEAESYVNARAAEDAARAESDEGAAAAGTRLIRAHPAVLIRRRARQDIVQLCERLGMSPATRYALLKEAAAGIPGKSAEDMPRRTGEIAPASALPHLFN